MGCAWGVGCGGHCLRGVEAKAALVGTNGRVELNAEAAVHAQHTLVVHPGDAELNQALGLQNALQHIQVLRVLGQARLDGLQHLTPTHSR
eukprot:1188908-Prorocentrum_minimum.AAC.5